MKKDYKDWHKKKSIINSIENRAFFHEREIWFCYIGENVGFEQDGKGFDFARPVLIIKGFNKEVFLSVPLTTKNKKGKYYADINLGDKVARKIILSQIRLVDSK